MYTARITRQHPTAFVIMIDRSGSMQEEVVFQHVRRSKADAVAAITNQFIQELINHCCREDGIRDYFDIAVLGYGADTVQPLLCPDEAFLRPSQLIRMPVRTQVVSRERRLPSGNTHLSTTECRYWVEPYAQGSTPLGAALAYTEKLLRAWCRRSPGADTFPPVVINITDGEASDADYSLLVENSEKIRATGTSNGSTLLFNIHLAASRSEDKYDSVCFPASLTELPPLRYARLMYDMSSTIPEFYNNRLSEAGKVNCCAPFKAMSYNCSIDSLFSFFMIGSASIGQIV